MVKAIIQSNKSDSFGKVRAIFHSGKTIPESFNFTPNQTKREILHSSFLKAPITNDAKSKEEFYDDKTDTSIDSDCESYEEQDDVMSKYMALKKMKYDDIKPNLFMDEGCIAPSDGREVKRSIDIYKIGLMRLSAIRSLLEKSANAQYNILKHSSPQLIRDLHKIIKYVAYTKNLKIPREYETFLNRHKKFLVKFIKEKSCIKKRKALLEKGASGFLGLLIAAMTSIASDILPTLLEPSPILAEIGEYPSNSVHNSSDDDSGSDSYSTSDSEKSENEGSDEEGEEEEESEEAESEDEEEEESEEEEMEDEGETSDDDTDKNFVEKSSTGGSRICGGGDRSGGSGGGGI